MFNRDGKLDVFEEFWVDWNLPKYRKLTENATESSGLKADSSGITIGRTWNAGLLGGTAQLARIDPRSMNIILPLNVSFWEKLKLLFRFKEREPRPSMSIEVFFRSVKNTAYELDLVQERADGYKQALQKAKEAGQQALFEQLTDGLTAARGEAQLYAMNLKKYLDEPQLVQFVKKCPKGLRLDWVQNFTRVIPDKVLDLKKRADALEVFDNYAVLHYDPEKKSWAETEAEKNRRKDPVLFGLIKGRRRLYFVGDWVDEYCDLTFDAIADTLGRSTIQEL